MGQHVVALGSFQKHREERVESFKASKETPSRIKVSCPDRYRRYVFFIVLSFLFPRVKMRQD